MRAMARLLRRSRSRFYKERISARVNPYNYTEKTVNPFYSFSKSLSPFFSYNITLRYYLLNKPFLTGESLNLYSHRFLWLDQFDGVIETIVINERISNFQHHQTAFIDHCVSKKFLFKIIMRTLRIILNGWVGIYIT